MNKLPLWALGVIIIGAGVFASQLGQSSTPMSAYEQGEAAGRGFVALLAWIVGLTLIAISVVKRVRSRKDPRSPRGK